MPDANINLIGQGNLTSLDLSQLLVNTLEGNVVLKGKLNWAKDITWVGDLNLKQININKLNDEYDGELNGLIKQAVTFALNNPSKSTKPLWTFDFPLIDLYGSFLKRPLTIKGKASGNANNGFIVNNLKLNNANNSILINGKVADENDLI